MIVKKQQRAPRAGFTLMELLVVVAILVMLAGIGGVIYQKYLDQAYRSKALIDLKMLSNVVDTYHITHGEYPPNLMVLAQAQADGTKPYLEPSKLRDPWGHEYQYSPQGQHNQLVGKPDLWCQPPAGNGVVIGNWMERAN